MRASIHDAGDMDVVIISKAKARVSISSNGKDDEVSLHMFPIKTELSGFHVLTSVYLLVQMFPNETEHLGFNVFTSV